VSSEVAGNGYWAGFLARGRPAEHGQNPTEHSEKRQALTMAFTKTGYLLSWGKPSRVILSLKADMEDIQKDQEFLEYVVKSLVNHPEDVKTTRELDDRGVKITLHVNPEDMGYIIGRQGQTARALRILLKIVGAKTDARVSMVIFEPEEMRRLHQEKKATMAPLMGAVAVSAPSTVKVHGDSGLVSDDDLSDLGI